MNLNLLKFIYNGLLFGMPSYISNPINKNNLHAPLCVKPYSTYFNYKLNEYQTNYINNYIKNYTSDLEIIPIKLSNDEYPYYYISVNIYNCTSPILMNNNNIVRCEINTYVINKDGIKGTLILDYLSNGISMDPVNIFKFSDSKIQFIKKNYYNSVKCISKEEKINLDVNYSLLYDERYYISDKLIKYLSSYNIR